MTKITFILMLSIILQISVQAGITLKNIDFLENSTTQDYDLIHYNFRLNVETNSRFLQGTVKITAKSLSNLESFEFQLHDNFIIDSIVFEGRQIGFKKLDLHRMSASLSRSIPPNDLFDVTIYYRGNAPLSTNDWGNGIVQKKESKYNAEVIYSLSVPYHAYEWYPCKQVLDDLIDSVKMTIITQKENTVVSNGLPVADVDLLNGKHAVTWQTAYPINYYLISFNVGKYIPYHTEVSLPGKNDAKMPIMNYLYNQNSLNKQKTVLDKLPDFLVNYSDLYGLYPFHREKFGTVVVPLSGGMEHQTIVNLATDYDKYLAAHEMAHQWWGDNINVRSYHDVWLSEGWATYSEYLTAEKLYPSEARSILDKFHNSALTQAVGQTYTVDTTNFSTIYNYNNVYMKGAAIIHTLRAEIGNDSLFFSSLSAFQVAFSHKSVSVQDFKKFLEKETGKNLDLFFNQWYYGFGYPKFTISWANSNDNLIIKSVQTTSSAKTPLFKTNIEFNIKRNNLPDTLLTFYQDRNEQLFIVEELGEVSSVALDPRNIILNKLNSSKVDPTLYVKEASEKKAHSVRIFPNPASDILNINTSISGPWRLEIISSDGIILYRKEIRNQNCTVPLHMFNQNSIFVKISSEQSQIWSGSVLLNR